MLSPLGVGGEIPSTSRGAGPAGTAGLVLRRVVARLSPATLVWVVLGALIIVPVGAFLLNAVSPRLFDQGSAWFTLSAIKRTFTGRNLHGFADSLFVSVSTAVLALATALAWLTQRTDLPGRRAWNLGMWGPFCSCRPSSWATVGSTCFNPQVCSRGSGCPRASSTTSSSDRAA